MDLLIGYFRRCPKPLGSLIRFGLKPRQKFYGAGNLVAAIASNEPVWIVDHGPKISDGPHGAVDLADGVWSVSMFGQSEFPVLTSQFAAQRFHDEFMIRALRQSRNGYRSNHPRACNRNRK